MGIRDMAPALLQTSEIQGDVGGGGVVILPGDAAAGPPSPSSAAGVASDPNLTPLPLQVSSLRGKITSLGGDVERSLSNAARLQSQSEALCTGAVMHASWPIEAIAVRRGVALSRQSKSSDKAREGMEKSLGHLLDVQAGTVDRIERMPSPFLWDMLHDLTARLEATRAEVDALSARLTVAERSYAAEEGVGSGSLKQYGEPYFGDLGPHATGAERLASIVRSQYDAFMRVAASVARANEDLERLRGRYRRSVIGLDGIDPFAAADAREVEEERRVQDQIRSAVANAAAVAAPPQSAPTSTATAPAPGSFGAVAPTPAPAGVGLFGAPAPAPAGGGLFGAPAPAPAGGGLFGAPAPAPAGGGLFGAPAPAPAGGGLFGTPAMPPAAGGGLFGSAPAPSPSTGFAFGGAPATPALGAAPAPTFGSAPRSKSKSRSSRRR